MNQLTDYILQPEVQLYRYDIIEPPKDWSSNFKNPEYVYPDTGIKNLAGAFFFFNSYNQAENTGYCAINRHTNLAKGLWITECTIKEPINLLDLRDSCFCIELLAVLDKSGFPIFTDKLKSWKGVSFAPLQNSIRPIEDFLLKDSSWINNQEQSTRIRMVAAEMERILSIPNDHIGYLLQLLTDYSNGLYFKSILHDKGYEGYIFNESNNLFPTVGMDTVCVWSSEKLYSPSCEQICLINKKEN